MAAKSKPQERLSLADLGVAAEDAGEAGSRTTVRSLAEPPRARRHAPRRGRRRRPRRSSTSSWSGSSYEAPGLRRAPRRHAAARRARRARRGGRARRRGRRPRRRRRLRPRGRGGRARRRDRARRRGRSLRAAAPAAPRRRSSRSSSQSAATTRSCSRTRCSPPTWRPPWRRASTRALNWDLTGLRADGDELVGTRPALQDSVLVEVGWVGTPRIGARPHRQLRADARGRRRAGRGGVGRAPAHAQAVRMLEQADAQSEGPKLEEADVIVAGGRGLGAAEGFELCERARRGARRRSRGDACHRRRRLVPLRGPGRPDRQDGRAEALHRGRHLRRDPAHGRDAGLRHDHRGQQGRHAPIFELADLGVVGDVQEVLPRLTELVKARRNGA